MSAYVSIRYRKRYRKRQPRACICQHTSAYVSIRQHTSAYGTGNDSRAPAAASLCVSIRQHTSAYVRAGLRLQPPRYASVPILHMSAYGTGNDRHASAAASLCVSAYSRPYETHTRLKRQHERRALAVVAAREELTYADVC
jgi:hypothetical protein